MDMASTRDAIDLLERARIELGRTILGHPAEIDLVLAAAATGNHVLLEDRPGVGKTTLARTLARVFGLEMRRIQGTTDLLPTDVTGVHVYQPSSESWAFRPGPVLSQLVLLDELNRATPKAQSALLEAMEEGQVTVDGETFRMPDPHVVIATQNPTGETGTHRLVAAQLDRFAVCVHLGLPGRDVERRLLDGEHRVGSERVGDPSDLSAVRSVAASLTVDPSVKDYVLDVVDAVRALPDDPWLSARVPLVLLDVARGLALLDGRDYIAPDDVRLAAAPVVRHRMPVRTDDALLAKAIESVDVP